jgi:putative ABC transport system permease protein
MLDHWAHDIRMAARGLRRAKGFTSAAVLTLAIGIAGTTMMFALIQGVLLRPLPVREQERLIVAWNEVRATGSTHWPFRAQDIDVIRDESRVLESVAGVSYYGGGVVTGDFFRVIGVEPILGRALNRGDDVMGAENVLLVTHGVWQRRYGGARGVIGQRMMVGETPFTIVGVMPRDFEGPPGVETWMTLAASASTVANPAFREGVLRDVDLIARLRPGATIEQARSELGALLARLEKDAPPDAVRGLAPFVRSYEDLVVGKARPALLVLFGAVGLVLFIASANVANLLLLRGEGRRRDLAVRAALGAGPGRLARQMLAESLLLALGAGLAGLAVTGGTLRVVLALVPDGLPRVDSVRIDGGVLAFTVAVAFVTALVAGLAPALSLARADLVPQLRSGGRGAIGSSGRPVRRALVVAQVALAVTVVAAAGLVSRSLLRLQTVDMGLAADRMVFVRLALPQTKYADGVRHLQFLEDVVGRLEAVPGIAGATPVNTPPFAGTGGWDAPEFTAEGQGVEQAARNSSLNLESIHPNYFETFEVTLVRGRGFTKADRRDALDVAVVSEDVAVRTWPGEDPIGKRIKLGNLESKEAWRTVVGVVRPTRYRELTTLRPTLYVPAEQFIVAAEILMLRTASPVALVADQVRETVRTLDPDVQVTRVAPFAELLQAPLARPRFNAFLIGVFGFAALLLAVIGLYAVMAASVRQRSTELGVRVAIGATASDVRSLVLGEGLRLAARGALIGLAGAAAATHLMRGLLFGVHPLDPVSLLAAALLMVGLSVLASYLPARRATRADPIALLRTE